MPRDGATVAVETHRAAKLGKESAIIKQFIPEGYEDILYTASHGSATSSYALITHTRGHVLATGRLKYGSPFPGDYATWRPDDTPSCVETRRSDDAHLTSA